MFTSSIIIQESRRQNETVWVLTVWVGLDKFGYLYRFLDDWVLHYDRDNSGQHLF